MSLVSVGQRLCWKRSGAPAWCGRQESGNAFNCVGSRWLFHPCLFQRKVGFCCWLLRGNGSSEGQRELVELESQCCRPWAGSLLREAFQNLGLAAVGTAGFCSIAHWEGLMVQLCSRDLKSSQKREKTNPVLSKSWMLGGYPALTGTAWSEWRKRHGEVRLAP